MTRFLGKTLLVITCSLISCNANDGIKPVPVIPIKPLYVFDLGSHGAGSGHHWYRVIDKNGEVFYFVDTEGKYSIGDSIK